MENIFLSRSQLFLRIALAASFLSAVADRFGIWGIPGTINVNWGNWENFLNYSNMVNSYASPSVGSILAVMATALEIILGIFILIGFKVKYSAIAAGILLASFGLAMTISFGVKPPLNYSVWTGAAACFLLGAIPANYISFSLDQLASKN